MVRVSTLRTAPSASWGDATQQQSQRMGEQAQRQLLWGSTYRRIFGEIFGEIRVTRKTGSPSLFAQGW